MEERINKLIKKFKQEHKNTKIASQEGNFSPLIYGISYFGMFSNTYRKYHKTYFKPALIATGKKTGMTIYSHESNKKLTCEIIEKYLNGDKEIIAHYDLFIKEIQEAYKKYHPDFLRKLNTEELVNLIRETFEKTHTGQTLTLFCEVLDEEIIREFYKRLKENYEEIEFENFMNHINTSDFIPFVHKFSKTLTFFENHYDVQWVLCNYLSAPHIDDMPKLVEEYFEKKGGKEKATEEYNQFLQVLKENKIKTSSFKISLTPSLLKLFEISNFAIQIRDERKEPFFKLITILSNSIRELFRRIDVPAEDIIYAFLTDFQTGIYKTTRYKELIQNRKNGFMIYYDENGVEYYYKDYNELKKILYEIKDNNLENNGLIRGSTACRGYAKGTARVILNENDFDRLNSGDILITSMTRPEFVPIMGKACAIITDEGGITCHAAIISREMNVPCIVGAQNATRIIKEGDFIEVDADRGVVRILEKK